MGDLDENIAAIAQSGGMVFRDPSLLRTALTHRSYLNEHPGLGWEDNERLEFLGDAVLDFLLAEYLYLQFPNASEGQLTGLRAAIVRRETLSRLARELDIGGRLYMGHGETETGGRDRPATLCAAFEALVGALYLDQGLPGVSAFLMPFINRELEGARVEAAGKDAKSRLQELSQGRLGITPRYRTVKAEGPDHAKTFTMVVYVGDVVCGEGEGPNKQLAAQRAAAEALVRLEEWLTGAAAVGE